MSKLKLKGRDLRAIGFPESPAISVTINVIEKLYRHRQKQEALDLLKNVLANPASYRNNEDLHLIAEALIPKPPVGGPEIPLNSEGVSFNIFGRDFIEEGALKQMSQAVRLPVSHSGALMPDAHQGYGLPIGGVLATENAVIPYGVGVDIACRMRLSVFDLPADSIETMNDRLVCILRRETLFGAGAGFKKPHEHEVLEEDW